MPPCGITWPSRPPQFSSTMAKLRADASVADRTTRAAIARRWIVVVGVVAMLAIAGSSTYDAWRSYKLATADTERELANVGKALAAQVEVSLRSIDVLLLATADWYARLPPDSTTATIESALARSAAELPQVSLLGITDAQGIRRYRSLDSASVDFDLAERPYFIAHRDNPASSIFVSEPIVTRSNGRVAIVLSRRLHDVKHSFSGIVEATVNLGGYQDFYRAINLGAASSIAMYRDDGTLVLRQPPMREAIGNRYPDVVQLADAPQSDSAFKNRSPIDGIARFVVATRVPNFPLIISVARDSSAVLAAWRAETGHVALRTLVIMLLGAFATAALARQFRRIELSQRALRQSEERYALALEGANEGHFDWNFDARPGFVSPQMQRLHGRVPGTPISTREAWMATLDIHPDDKAGIEEAINKHMQGGLERYDTEYRVRHPDGDWHWLHARGRFMRDASGASDRLVGSVIDITARKNAEAEKDRLEIQLRQSQKMEAMGTLAGGIAHDFNNILSAILGYGELAQKAAPATGAMRRYLDNVMQAGGRAKALVERILAFSRSGVGERGLINVQAVIGETLELLAASVPPNVRVEQRLDAGDAAIMGDVTQLHQVAMNLLTNALQAMKDGGVLAVQLQLHDIAQHRDVSHGHLAAGPYVCLRVSDTGSGIAPDVLERMFDPFYTTKGIGEGTGLGLSLVHGIVADLGGAIDVRSVLGQGAAFSIWLPTSGIAARVPEIASADLPHGAGQTVIIVDDETTLVALAEEMLAQLGYEPIGFSSGAAALAALRKTPDRFDVVLTDESMPGLTGTALAAAVRSLRPDLPVVLMSGYGTAALHERAAALGVRDILRKPLRSSDLAECIGRVLNAHTSVNVAQL
jgi:PAS domain S-box-containing protein